MAIQQSLNPVSPELIPHGTEISIQCNGITIGEIYEMSYDEDNNIEAINQLGSRIIGRRRGQYEIKGSIKSYWVNSTLRSMAIAGDVPSSSGMQSNIYHSQAPFQRYDILVNSTNPNAPSAVLKNVVFEKDSVTWTADKVTEDDISFFAEELWAT